MGGNQAKIMRVIISPMKLTCTPSLTHTIDTPTSFTCWTVVGCSVHATSESIDTFSFYLVRLDKYRIYIYPEQPFEAIFPFVKQITSFLEKLITWPRDLGAAIKNCQESFPSPM
jgi:hypothetical protein